MRGATPGILALLMCLTLAATADAVDLTGLKGLGGSGGVSTMIGDWQYRDDATPNFSGDAVFKYGWSPHWVLVTGFGFTWNGYKNEESWLQDVDLLRSLGYEAQVLDKVSTMAPFTVGVEYRFGTGENVPYVGAGGGVYMTQMLFNRSVGVDPRNGARHRSFDPGFYGRIGVEHFLSDVMSIDYDALVHVVFCQDTELFPDITPADRALLGNDFMTYSGDMQNVQVRIGLRYYWGGGL